MGPVPVVASTSCAVVNRSVIDPSSVLASVLVPLRFAPLIGPVSVSAVTGPIKGTNLNGTRTLARTEDGSITLRLTTAQDVDASTGTGPISVTVPPFDGGYRVHTQTETGPTSVHVPDSPTGARSLTLSSTDGGITVDQG